MPRRIGSVRTPGRAKRSITRPSSAISPPSSRWSPASASSTVDFPAPLRPMIASVSPGATSNATSTRNARRCTTTCADSAAFTTPHGRPPAAHQQQNRDGRHQQQECERDRGALTDAATIERGVDREGHGLGDAGTVAGEQGGGAELADRAREAQHDPGDDAGGRERQRHAPEDRDPRRTERGRGPFDLDAGAAQRPLHGEHEERQRHVHLREHDRGGGEGQTETAEPAGAAEEVEERDAADHGREHQRHGHERAEQGRQACRAPRDHQRERDADRRAHERRHRPGAQREAERLQRRGRGDVGDEGGPVDPRHERGERHEEEEQPTTAGTISQRGT